MPFPVASAKVPLRKVAHTSQQPTRPASSQQQPNPQLFSHQQPRQPQQNAFFPPPAQLSVPPRHHRARVLDDAGSEVSFCMTRDQWERAKNDEERSLQVRGEREKERKKKGEREREKPVMMIFLCF